MRPIQHAVAISRLSALMILTACLMLVVACGPESSQQPKQQSFVDPADAVEALLAAMRTNDLPQLVVIFGPDVDDVLASGDPVSDQHDREVFRVALEQKWELLELSDTMRELVIGHDRWPFPIPLVKDDGGWRYDTAAGKQEALARRVGRNELAAIGACQTYVIAQREYASEGRDGNPAGIFAQKIHSDHGRQNGLYWPQQSGDTGRSPLGDLVARAESEGYDITEPDRTRPFHGYHFRILTKQGDHAIGGAKQYIVDGQMTQGFALIAYPAEYGSSGIMTFIVNQDGVIYESDLGADTLTIARQIDSFNPAETWHPLGGDATDPASGH